MTDLSISSKFNRLYVVGAGGFGREVAWLASEISEQISIRFVVDSSGYLCEPINGVSVELITEISYQSTTLFVVAVGDPQVRCNLAEKMKNLGFTATNLIHPTVQMSKHVSLGKGVIIAAGNILTTNIYLGDHTHINLACTIGHNVTIGSYTTLSPGVHVSGNVQIGQGVFIGTGAVIINGTVDKPLIIGNGAVIAAGACITKSVEAGAMMAGVPALRKR